MLFPVALHPTFQKLLSDTRRNETILRCVLLFISLALLAAAYQAGLAAGLDAYVGKQSGGVFLNGVCAVATKWLTGVGNYVCLGEVSNIMSGLGLTAGGPNWPGYLADREFLDQALHHLFERPHWIVSATTSGPPYSGITGIGWGMDSGYADFVSLAFHVFGPAVESLYRGYWLVSGVSYLLFAIAYRRAVVPLVLLVVAAIGQYLIFTSGISWSASFEWFPSQNAHLYGPSCPRFLSSLCVVPALHFLCATWGVERLRRYEVILLGLQGVILCLAIQQRTTVYWVVAAALLLATLQWFFLRRCTPVEQKKRRALILAGLLVLVALNNVYVKITTHPGLAVKGFTATHTLWGSLFYTMQLHPDWNVRYSAEFGHNNGDDIATFAWQRYLAQHPEEGEFFRNKGDNITQALIEQMTKKAFIEFAKRDPFFVLDMYVSHNPRYIYVEGAGRIREVIKGIPVIFPVFLIALGFIFGIMSSCANLRLLIVSVPLVTFLCIVSSLPSWATLVIRSSLTDFLMLLVIVGMLLMVVLGAAGGFIFRRFSGLPQEIAVS